MNGYGQLLRSDREKRVGGVGFFIRKGIKVQIKAITNNEHVQLLTVALLGYQNEKVITVGYKTPNYGIEEYINVCQEHLNKFTIKPESLQVFCGDFNLNVIEQTNKIAKVLDFFSCTGLQIKNRSEPTRVTSCTATCIDIFFANFEASVNVKDTMISDHRGVELSCKKTRVDPEKSKEKLLFRPLKKLQNKELRLDLNYSIAKKLGTRSKLYLSSDLDFSFTDLMRVINEELDRHVPLQQFKKHTNEKFKQVQKPWLNNQIKNLSLKKLEAYQRLKNEQSAENREKYNKLRNRLKNLTKKAKIEFYEQKIEGKANINKSLFSIIDDIKGTKIKKTNDNLNADEINKYFVEIGKKLSESCSLPSDLSRIRKLENSMFLTNVTAKEVFDIIKQMPKKTSSDLQNISNQLIKLINPSVCETFANLINRCFNEGHFPRALKIANVISLYKNGNENEFGNCRPISLLPVISKIVEKCLQKRLISFLSKYSVINKAQFGHQAKKNTIDAVSEVVETIRISLCSKESYYGVFIDLSKAFDTVSHEILLQKRFAHGLRGKIYDILNSYLTNRQQCVSVSKQRSSFESIFCGVPQGSVLGPLLFLIYVNDLPAFCTNCNVTMFADDTNIYGMMDDGINDTIENVSVWVESNKLAINRDKCKSISFGATNETPEIKIYDYSF